MSKNIFVLILLFYTAVQAQTYALDLGADLYLPSLAEKQSCEAERALGFGFPEHHIEIMKSPMFYGEVQGTLEQNCFLFRDVFGAEARLLVADIMHMFVNQGYWHGIPNDFSGMQLVQNNQQPNQFAFSFLNEDKWLGPYAGVAGFDLAFDEGLLMYLWAYHGFY